MSFPANNASSAFAFLFEVGDLKVIELNELKELIVYRSLRMCGMVSL